MIIPALITAALIYGNLITILCFGFTLTYITAKIPNFAHGTYAGVGIYVTYTISVILKLNPYIGLPLAFIVGGIIGLILYTLVINVLNRLGRSKVTITISTLAIQIFLSALVYIYAFYLHEKYHTYAIQFQIKNLDFTLAGLPGILLISSGINILTIFGMHYILTKTKTGIAMRAVSEDVELSSIMGINVDRIQGLSWFITGGLACIAGSMLPFWFVSYPTLGNQMMVSIMAGSLLGGFSNITGAIFGGFAIGLSEILLTRRLMGIFGIWVGEYRTIIPTIILISVMMIEPKGLNEIYIRLKERLLEYRGI